MPICNLVHSAILKSSLFNQCFLLELSIATNDKEVFDQRRRPGMTWSISAEDESSGRVMWASLA